MQQEIDCCWKCGYDLTKAAGPYVRCPECGMVTNRLTAARDLDRWRVLRWSRWVAACGAGVGAVVAGLVAATVVVVALQIRTELWWLISAGGFVLASVVIGLVAWATTPGERRRGQLLTVALVSVVLGGVTTFLVVRGFWLALGWFIERNFVT